MTVLALDTSSEHGSVAIRSGGRILAEASIHSQDGFSHLVFDAIEKMKNEANLPLEAIDCFAAANGPGSFTGVRVALGAIKGLGESTTKPVAGISNLQALSSLGKKHLRAVALDARRGDAYVAVYDAGFRVVVPEAVLPFRTWLDRLDPALEYEFVCLPGSGFRALLEGTKFAEMEFTEAGESLAAGVTLCAEALGQGSWGDPAELDANYVRRSDAQLYWQDRG